MNGKEATVEFDVGVEKTQAKFANGLTVGAPPFLCLAVCTLGAIRIEHELTMVHQVYPMSMRRTYLQITGLSTVDARNMAVQNAKDMGAEILLFYDDDIIPRDPYCVSHILQPLMQNDEIDIVGGVYPRKSEMPEPLVSLAEGKGAWWGWEDGGLHKVFMTGTGFAAYRMSSLDKLDVREYEITVTENGKKRGIPAREVFEGDETSDDVHLAIRCRDKGLNWYVAGNAVADQISLDGRVFRVEDAKIKFPEIINA